MWLDINISGGVRAQSDAPLAKTDVIAMRSIVHQLRRLLLDHRLLAGWVIVIALVMKIMVPAGFMPMVSHGQIVVSVCSGTGPTTMLISIPGMEDGQSGDHDSGSKHEPPCAFSGLSMQTLAGADAVLLASALLFVMALGLQAAPAIKIQSPSFLRPPLRAPPTKA